MGKYNKFIVALVGAIAIGASSAGWISEAETQSVSSAVLALLAAVGVFAVPNG